MNILIYEYMKVKANHVKEEIERYYNENCSLYHENLSCNDHSGELFHFQGKILDLGCGTLENGYNALSGVHIVALDINEKAIEKARIKAKEKFPDIKIDFTVANMEDIPMKDNEFDGVFSNCVVNHSKNKQKVFHEIYRVLKPGSAFVLSDAFTREPLPEQISSNPEQVAGCFGGAELIGNYLNYMMNSGFTQINIRKNREYIKNGFDFISATMVAKK